MYIVVSGDGVTRDHMFFTVCEGTLFICIGLLLH